jgi:Bifunctional DNA primase/polymerase, N-terminal
MNWRDFTASPMTLIVAWRDMPPAIRFCSQPWAATDSRRGYGPLGVGYDGRRVMSTDFFSEYRRRGWSLVPTATGSKRPTAQGWQTRAWAPEDFALGGNVSVILGPRSGNLTDIDLDCPEALALADIYLPPTDAVFGRASKPRSHRLYVSAGAVFEAFADPLSAAGNMLLELRAQGRDGGAHQTLIPPSIADGERREWEGESIEPAPFDAAKLRRRCAYLAIGCLIRRHVSKQASEHPAPDFPHLLYEAEPVLGRVAYRWLGMPDPDAPQWHTSIGAITRARKSTSPSWSPRSRMIATGTAGTALAWRSSRHPAARTKAASSSMRGAPSRHDTTLTRPSHVGGVGTNHRRRASRSAP